jgi:hypothetical protein
MTMEPILILFARMNGTCCNQDWLLKESCARNSDVVPIVPNLRWQRCTHTSAHAKITCIVNNFSNISCIGGVTPDEQRSLTRFAR